MPHLPMIFSPSNMYQQYENQDQQKIENLFNDLGVEMPNKLIENENQSSLAESNSESKSNAETLPQSNLIQLSIPTPPTKEQPIIQKDIVESISTKTTRKKVHRKKAISHDLIQTAATSRKKAITEMKQRRLQRNRECARESRKRKKEYISSLENKVNNILKN